MKSIFKVLLCFVLIFTGCTSISPTYNHVKFTNTKTLNFSTKLNQPEITLPVPVGCSYDCQWYTKASGTFKFSNSSTEKISGGGALEVGTDSFRIVIDNFEFNGTIPHTTKLRGSVTGTLTPNNNPCVSGSRVYVADHVGFNAYSYGYLGIESGTVTISAEGNDIVANVSNVKSSTKFGRDLISRPCEEIDGYFKILESGDFTVRLPNVARYPDKINISLLPHAFSDNAGAGGGCIPENDDSDIEVDPTNPNRPWNLEVDGNVIDSGIGKKKKSLGSGFRVQSVVDISASDIKAYYTDEPNETFSPPNIQDNDLNFEVSPENLDAMISKLDNLTALDIIKDDGFKISSLGYYKYHRKNTLLYQAYTEDKLKINQLVNTLDSQLEDFTNEIDKISQTRYFIGKPINNTPVNLFNSYKDKVSGLLEEFDNLILSDNTFSLVEASANLAKQIQMYMFMIRDLSDGRLPEQIQQTEQLDKFKNQNDYYSRITKNNELILYLQHNIESSKSKIKAQHQKIKNDVAKIDLVINQSQTLINKIDTEKVILNNSISLLEQKITELGGTFNTQSLKEKNSFSIKGEAEEIEKRIAFLDDKEQKLANERINLINDLADLVNNATDLDLPLLRTRLDMLKDILKQQQEIRLNIELIEENAGLRKKRECEKEGSFDCLYKDAKFINPSELNMSHEIQKNKAYNLLLKRILEEGILEPLPYIIKNGRKVLIDGNNRLSIVNELRHRPALKDKFKTIPAKEVTLPYKDYPYRTPADVHIYNPVTGRFED